MKETKLSTWASQQNPPIPYKTAWTQHKNGELPVKTKETKTGRIMVLEETKANKISFAQPMATDVATLKDKKISTASVPLRRTKIATSPISDQYYNIWNGISPQIFAFGGYDGGSLQVLDAIRLTQKAYWNFSIIRNIIDAMTEFSCSPIYLRGGSKKVQDFFYSLFRKINLSSFLDEFFREYFRSGNVFIYRYDSLINEDDIPKLNTVFGIPSNASKNLELPIKYITLNPTDVEVQANVSFANPYLFKRFTGYEVARLRKPQTQQEQDMYDSLPDETKKAVDSGAGTVLIRLDQDNVYAIFYKKQSYEPLSIPLIWPVLRDIEWKQEMKNIDMAAARTMQKILLWVKVGYESKGGEYVVDQGTINAVQSLLQSESVGQSIVVDFATEAEYVIPDIANFLDPKKYEIVNEDIRIGLNNILIGNNEKFANQQIQVKLFIRRLEEARTRFLNDFLIPEMRRLAQEMGFQNYPQPYFEDVDLKDPDQWNRIVAQLASLGIFTPAESFNAIETGRIPTEEESVESQQKLLDLKNKGYYQPLIGGGQQQQKGGAPLNNGLSPDGGRPQGTSTPQTTKKVAPQKMTASFSGQKIVENSIKASKLENEVKELYLKKYKLKDCDENQNKEMRLIKEIVMANEVPINWSDKKIIKSYIDNPIDKNQERISRIEELAYQHNIEPYLAAILMESKVE